MLGEIARQYAEGGWRVFPVDPVSKRPRTRHGHLDATTDIAVVRSFWDTWPDAAIATPTGDGLLVVDVDPRNGGTIPSWAPETRLVRTQSGGFHLHYTIDDDIKSRASLFGPGVDSKCAGGYVLLPPSPGYSWSDLRPRARLTKAWLETKVDPQQQPGMTKSATRLAPQLWRRGIIHDQVVAWAAYFARELTTDAEVETAVWAMVNQARASGVAIDNARGHIDSAIRWVIERERSK